MLVPKQAWQGSQLVYQNDHYSFDIHALPKINKIKIFLVIVIIFIVIVIISLGVVIILLEIVIIFLAVVIIFLEIVIIILVAA